MSHTDFLCSPEGGGGGGVALRCTVGTCIHMEKFLPLYSRDLDTPDRYQNIPILQFFLLMNDTMYTVP